MSFSLFFAGWCVLQWLATNLYFAYRQAWRYSLGGVFVLTTGAACGLSLTGESAARDVLVLHVLNAAGGVVIMLATTSSDWNFKSWKLFCLRSILAGGGMNGLAWGAATALAMLLDPQAFFHGFVSPTFPASVLELPIRIFWSVLALVVFGMLGAVAGAVCGLPLALFAGGIAAWRHRRDPLPCRVSS